MARRDLSYNYPTNVTAFLKDIQSLIIFLSVTQEENIALNTDMKEKHDFAPFLSGINDCTSFNQQFFYPQIRRGKRADNLHASDDDYEKNV